MQIRDGSTDQIMGLHTLLEKPVHRIRQNAFAVGLLSLIWFLLRTGTKPSRAAYPCQRAAAANSYVWLTVFVLPFLSTVPRGFTARRKLLISAAIVAVLASSLVIYEMWPRPQPPIVALTLTGKSAASQPASDIFVVNGTSGTDGGVTQLINLMGEHELLFYRSSAFGKNRGQIGLFARDDVVLVKVNSQWQERGGTNTDLLRALIRAILDHPDGFVGEIVVADNGQAQAGSTNSGGSFSWGKSNAEDNSQSVQKVVDSFAGSYRVSTYLWDAITTKTVKEYSEGDLEDGYIVNATTNPRTGIKVSYPKFKTKFGTYVSFKHGIWNPETRTYNNKLKVINVPVLKSHSAYGVTASVKHYMGVVSDILTSRLGASSHQSVGKGGMGTEMVETRYPTLNILDAIWVNANPGMGPATSYRTATRVNVIAASTDPVAIDYWAAKYILLQVARIRGYSGTSSFDPSNNAEGSFGNWLRLSLEEIRKAGYQVTMDEAYMNIYVEHLPPSS